MKVITRKNNIVLAELNPDAEYIMLVNPMNTRMETIHKLQTSTKVHIQVVLVQDINGAIRFVEIPKKV